MYGPIIFNPIENNPYFWWNGLEIPIQLEYLFDRVMAHEITIKELVDAVNKFYADFDDTVKQEVIDKINEMYESGELRQIIAGAIADSITGKSGNIDLAHMGYILHQAHSYGVSELPPKDAALTIDEELFSALQGNCVFNIGGNKYWACCYVCQNGSHFDNGNAARIYVYTVNNDNSLSYVTDKEFAALGHCNSMTYLNGYLYISPNSYAGTGGGTTTDVHRIAFDGSSLGGTWHPESQTYRAETKTPTGWIYNTAYSDHIYAYNNRLYLCDSVMNLYIYDWDTNTVTLSIPRLNGEEGALTSDGFAITDNYIYMGASGYRIKRYSKMDGVIDWVIQLPAKPNNGAFKIGEIEGFTVDENNMLYLAGFYNLNSESTRSNTYSITHFYCQNLATNEVEIPNFINWSNGYLRANAVFAVDGNLPGDRDNPRNDYFHVGAAQVAVDFIETNDYIERGMISIRQYRNMSTIDIRTAKPITIDGNYYINHSPDAVSPSIGHIYCISNSNLFIMNVTFNNRLPEDINNTNVTDNCIFCLGGNIAVQNCAFSTGLITNSATVKYAIKAYHGILNARTDASYSTNPEQWVQYREQAGITNPAYTAGSDIIRNINQVVTGN